MLDRRLFHHAMSMPSPPPDPQGCSRLIHDLYLQLSNISSSFSFICSVLMVSPPQSTHNPACCVRIIFNYVRAPTLPLLQFAAVVASPDSGDHHFAQRPVAELRSLPANITPPHPPHAPACIAAWIFSCSAELNCKNSLCICVNHL